LGEITNGVFEAARHRSPRCSARGTNENVTNLQRELACDTGAERSNTRRGADVLARQGDFLLGRLEVVRHDPRWPVVFVERDLRESTTQDGVSVFKLSGQDVRLPFDPPFSACGGVAFRPEVDREENEAHSRERPTPDPHNRDERRRNGVDKHSVSKTFHATRG